MFSSGKGLGNFRGNVRSEKTKSCTTLFLCMCYAVTVLVSLECVTIASGRAVDVVEEEDTMRPSLERILPEGLSISVPRMEAAALLAQKFKDLPEEQEQGTSERANNPRALWSKDFERKASELCGTSASLQCGKRTLTFIDGQENDLDVHAKCDLRDDFLKCISTEKKGCLELVESSVLPELPPKEVIKMEQSKLWKVLWTAGGCVLAD